ncbi:site-2 protease family protein [Planctomyces sp. SH-PL62]|uniref:site-2 protease family protein n=1 Tax=Planctomyces sp. SH-PL62 TaxID=1636152 RepID=UPI00078D8EAE|nr:site-2 protease family protein [Planctomyces sp. SH-PL62]AMV38703.1 Putative zinc metalloprotease Rip3 [Planctomyces sp. SH-PL62]
MSWSWNLGRVAGIPIFVHWTFLILIAWLVAAGVMENRSLVEVLEQGAFVVALFGCVVLHELGHALTARRFGVPTSDITLLPIGGVARLQRIPDRPGQELLVALAGPAVNVVIVALMVGVFGVRLPSSADSGQVLHAGFWSKILLVNVFLAGFNMLPAFPMDGGRVLRALLAMKLPYAKATRLAASIGQLMAIAFGLFGLSNGAPMLLFIALFVWIGAESEAVQVAERAALKDVAVQEAMLTDFHTLQDDDTLGRAAELLLAGTQQDFPVVQTGGGEGDADGLVLTRANLMAGLSARGPEAPIREFATAAAPTVDADGPLVAAVGVLRERGVPCLQVTRGGRVVGLLTLENVGELLMVREALGKVGDGSVAPAGGERVY